MYFAICYVQIYQYVQPCLSSKTVNLFLSKENSHQQFPLISSTSHDVAYVSNDQKEPNFIGSALTSTQHQTVLSFLSSQLVITTCLYALRITHPHLSSCFMIVMYYTHIATFLLVLCVFVFRVTCGFVFGQVVVLFITACNDATPAPKAHLYFSNMNLAKEYNIYCYSL